MEPLRSTVSGEKKRATLRDCFFPQRKTVEIIKNTENDQKASRIPEKKPFRDILSQPRDKMDFPFLKWKLSKPIFSVHSRSTDFRCQGLVTFSVRLHLFFEVLTNTNRCDGFLQRPLGPPSHGLRLVGHSEVFVSLFLLSICTRC
jgi:hypothetical protein